MPSKTGPKPANTQSHNLDSNEFVNDYLADWDDDDPFRSPSPEPGKKAAADKNKNPKKRKEPDTLGIDKQIDLTKKARAPAVKLDETRLLSDKGIPKLRKMAPKLIMKGKGHEFSDAARLLSFYQHWLDDLFPKAKFLDALAMVEKAGHRTQIRNERLRWIDEGRPKGTAHDDNDGDDDDPFRNTTQSTAPKQPSRVAPIFDKAAQNRPGTPPPDDSFNILDEDIYNATPRASTPAPARQVVQDDVPDGDDLDALMAEAESGANNTTSASSGPAFGSIFGKGASIFGNGPASKPSQSASNEPDDDELDALMAEAETQAAPSRPPQLPSRPSIFGGGASTAQKKPAEDNLSDDDDDLDALMAEAEAQVAPAKSAAKPAPPVDDTAKGKESTAGQGEEDDLDALMAEAESVVTRSAAATAAAAAEEPTPSYDEDEEALAEMDGLW
ncbi:replication fork protection component Swi3-domain-containing protein [Podospora didyma]|uniref:Chromosome segregation in meiosis protein n=1 Tax=Podospora didyma TaxID=330526 RepID=A0AAE0K945_9PEZI|nr:replication fork protection component Swi3-domain-containing protein [Podospora didyma]